MRRNLGLLLGIGCLLAVAGACDDGGTTAPPAGNTAGGGTTTAGTTGAAGTPTSGAGTTGGTSTAGTTGGGAAGRATGAAGRASGTAGSGTGTAGDTATGTAGSSGGAAGAVSAPTGEGFAMCGVPPKEGECKAKGPGIYALKTEVDVWFRDEFNNPPIFDAGRGTITIYIRGALSDFCEDGSMGKGVMKACGTTLPGLYADANGGVIQITFPNEIWDSPMMPSFNTTGSSSGFNVGDLLTIDQTASLIGIDIAGDAATAAWPSFTETATFACTDGKTGEACFPDHDGDGHPGVTVKMQTEGTPPSPGYATGLGTEWKYVPAPIDIAGAAFGMGAETVYTGLRTRLGGSGKIAADCSSGTGAATAQDFESRVWGCVMVDGSACSETGGETSGVGFLDKNTPAFHVLQEGATPPPEWKHPRAEADALLNRMPSKGPQSSVVRLGDLSGTFSCADVRNAAFPTAM